MQAGPITYLQPSGMQCQQRGSLQFLRLTLKAQCVMMDVARLAGYSAVRVLRYWPELFFMPAMLGHASTWRLRAARRGRCMRSTTILPATSHAGGVDPCQKPMKVLQTLNFSGWSESATPHCVATALNSSLLLRAFLPPGLSFRRLCCLHGGANVNMLTMPDEARVRTMHRAGCHAQRLRPDRRTQACNACPICRGRDRHTHACEDVQEESFFGPLAAPI